MSSSNLVSLIMLKEASYGVTPDLASATALQMRYNSETLSGTPTVQERAEIRPDRMSAGQVVTGSEIGGDTVHELAKDPTYDDLIEAAMMTTWVAADTAAMTQVTVTEDGGNDQLYTITATGGVMPTLVAGDVIQLAGFTGDDAAFNGTYSVVTRDSDLGVTAYGPRGLGNTSAPADIDASHPSYADIGSVVNSFTLSKAYRDVTHAQTTDYHGQTYAGALVSTWALTAAYGEITGSTFTFLANGWTQDLPSLEQALVTAGGSVDPAGTSDALNATLDSGLVTVDNVATEFCIESVGITLENNMEPQNCIGKLTPDRYTIGKAAISLNLSVYNTDPSYDTFMARKWSQQPTAVTFSLVNASGGYVVSIRAAQLTFPDPASGGENSQVMMEITGVAKVGANGESAARIYRIEAA